MNPAAPTTATDEPELLAAARGGDDQAFEGLIAPYRPELQAHCYRMMGSVQDCEDALQESLLRAWKGLSRFEGRSSLRTWLYRIATNTCLRALERRPRRVLPVDYGPATDPHTGPAEPLTESVWIEPYPDEVLMGDGDRFTPEARYEQRESVELAFTAALQHLPPRQRAVLILRDVLGFSPAEIADTLEATPAAVYSALQRAHAAVAERLPEQSQQQTLRALGDSRLRSIVGRYVDAWERGDVQAIVAMLAEDAVLTMPPRPSWYRGRETVGWFLGSWPLARGWRWRLLPIRASGQPAFATYGTNPSGESTGHSIQVLTLTPGGAIEEIATYLGAELFPSFGLADAAPS